MPSEPNEPNSKTFSLKESETNLLIYIQQHQQAIYSGILSTIAIDRLAYKITDRTQFEISPDVKTLKMTERPVEPEPTENKQATENTSPVVAAPEKPATEDTSSR